MVRVFANGQRDQSSILSRVTLMMKKMALYALLLQVRIKSKWSNSGKEVEPSLHLSVLANKKEAF